MTSDKCSSISVYEFQRDYAFSKDVACLQASQEASAESIVTVFFAQRVLGIKNRCLLVPRGDQCGKRVGS